MTATAGLLLVEEIMPLIQAAIGRGAVKPVGAEDAQELAAEAVAMAAEGLDSAERRGKVVSANSVAYYAIEGLKQGRRSGYAGKSDVMSAGARLAGHATVTSMDAELGVADDDPDEPFTLHSLLAGTAESADIQAGRHLDWDEVWGRLDDKRRLVLRDTAAGYGPGEIAAEAGVSAPRVIQLRDSIADTVADAWGGNPVADSAMGTRWQRHVHSTIERRAARYARATA